MWSFFVPNLTYICAVKKNIHIILISLIFSVILWGSISLSNDYFTTIDVKLKLVNFPEGYTTGSKLPERVTVKIRGNGWKLISVTLGADVEYVVSVQSDSGRKYVNLYNFLIDNQWISHGIEVIDISPDTLSFFVERIISKKLKIIPDFAIDFKPGYGLASPAEIFPDSTVVYGPVSIIRNMNDVKTELIRFEHLDGKKIQQVALKDRQGLSYENRVIRVALDVQKIIDKNLDDLQVEVLNVPADRDVVLLPNRISISIRGGIDILGKLNTAEIKSFVHYRDVVLDTAGSISPRIELPENVYLVFSRPERLRYIIKKFN